MHILFIVLLQTIAHAVAKSMTMTAQQVVKDEYGAEVSSEFFKLPSNSIWTRRKPNDEVISSLFTICGQTKKCSNKNVFKKF